jgi:hypothetical protein
VNLCRPSPVPLANFQFAQLRPVLWTGPPTPNFRKRKSEICLAEVVRVPRPTRKSTKCTNRGQGRAAPKERPQPSKFSKETCDCGNRSPPPYASPGAKPSRTSAVVFRPPSPPLRERVGRGTRTTSAEQVFGGNLRVPRGEAFKYIRCRFASPSRRTESDLLKRDSLVVCRVRVLDSFLMTASSHGKHGNHTETRKI